MKKSLLTLALAAVVGLSASANTMDFHYNTIEETTALGNGVKENYEVAIRLLGSKFKKMTINSFKYQLNGASGISNVKAWLAPSLTGAQAFSADATIDPQTGEVNVTVPDGYAITAQGVYVGLSFTVSDTNVAGYPLVVTNEVVANGLYAKIPSAGSSWAQYGYCLTTVVNISGDFEDNAMELSKNQAFYLPANEASVQEIAFTNNGAKNIETVDYSFEVNGQTVSGTAKRPEFPMVNYTQKSTFPIDVPALPVGTYPTTINVSKINGQDVTVSPMDVTFAIPSFLVQRIPVMEEYTGNGCGYCPRGFAAVEKINQEYGDLYIAYAMHNGGYAASDPMCIKSVPNSVSGYPAAYFNRVVQGDPYYGSGNSAYGAIDLLASLAQNYTPAALSLTSQWDSDAQEVIKAKTTVKFSEDVNEEYRISYLVLANGLYFEDLKQSNYFSGAGGFEGDPYMAPFINGGSYVSGLTWNDVVIYLPETKGYANSLPASLKAGEEYTFEKDLPVSEFVNKNGQSIVQDKSKLSVVTLVTLARTGEIMNALRADIGAAAENEVTGGGSGENPDNPDDSVETLLGNAANSNVYGIDGTLVIRDANEAQINALPAGLYIVNGKKVLVK